MKKGDAVQLVGRVYVGRKKGTMTITNAKSADTIGD
jgi:hypothetical protein